MPVTFQSIELSPKEKATLFIIELTKYSDNKDDPVSDWEFNDIKTQLDGNSEFNCICSTRIKNLYRIHKKSDNMVFIDIGSECINRWLNPFIECDDCYCALSNKMKRIKTKDFLCKKCKKKREAKILQEITEKRKQEHLESELFYKNLKDSIDKETLRIEHQRDRIKYLGDRYYYDDVITYRKLKDIVDNEELVLSILQRTEQVDVIEYITYFYTINY